jgi:hypothetical protein
VRKRHKEKRATRADMIRRRIGVVHYDPGTHRFIQPREILADKAVLCGDRCYFYDDAKTNVLKVEISEGQLLAMIPVPDPSACRFAQRDESMGSWRVKGKWDKTHQRVVQ